MVCQDEYEMALAEGSASEETLEGMRQNIMAIEDAIRNLPAPGEDSTDLIVYEPAEKGYKDWNEQLLAKSQAARISSRRAGQKRRTRTGTASTFPPMTTRHTPT